MSLAALVAAAAAVAAWWLPPGRWRPIVAGLLLSAIGAGSLAAGAGTDRLDRLGGLLLPGGRGPDGFVATGLALVLAGLAAGGLVAWRRPLVRAGGVPPAEPGQVEALPVLLGALAALSPQLPATLGLCFAAGALDALRPGRTTRHRGVLAAGLVALGTAGLLLATVIGPLSPSYAALKDGPLGDQAARLVMLLLALPGTVFLLTGSLAVAGAALVVRVGGELLPAGLALWQGAVLPLLLALAWTGVVRRHSRTAVLAAAGYGFWSGVPSAQAGGGLMVAGMLVAGAGRWPGRSAGLGPRLASVLMAAGLPLVVAGGLGAQVVYTLALAPALAALLLRRAAVAPT